METWEKTRVEHVYRTEIGGKVLYAAQGKGTYRIWYHEKGKLFDFDANVSYDAKEDKFIICENSMDILKFSTLILQRPGLPESLRHGLEHLLQSLENGICQDENLE